MAELRHAHARAVESPRDAALIMSPGARHIVQAALREEITVAELADRAAADPAFAIRVLSVANSVAYSPSRTVNNVHHACTLLGVRGLRNIALSMVVADLVPAAEGADALLSNCLRRAVAARELAALSGLVHKEDGFFAGLFLEVGLLHQACDEFDACTAVARAPARYRNVHERAFGLSPHPVMGASLARELGLPDDMGQAIFDHHRTQKPEAALSAVCWAAEHVAAALEAGERTRNLRWAEKAATSLGVKGDDLHALLERIPGEVQELCLALECGPRPLSSRRGLPQTPEDPLAEMHVQYDELVRVIEQLLDERDELREALGRTASR